VVDGVDLRAMLEHQIQLIESRDLDGLMDQYEPDAVLVRFDRVANGKEEIRELMGAYLALSPRMEKLDAYAGSGDSLSYQATMVIGGRPVRTYGAWVLRGNRIWRQFAGIIP
jgi:ketosteroid isomerase-like protein